MVPFSVSRLSSLSGAGLVQEVRDEWDFSLIRAHSLEDKPVTTAQWRGQLCSGALVRRQGSKEEEEEPAGGEGQGMGVQGALGNQP